MALDPDAKRFLDAMAAQPGVPPDQPLDPVAMRAMFAQAWRRPGPFEPVGDAYGRSVSGPAGDIPVLVYVPDGAGPLGDAPYPVLVWFHGGGWVIGSPDDNDEACRAVCNLAGIVVVSVDYRLAPENPFPAAADDAYAVVEYVAAHGAEFHADGGRIAVGGESAGGNLAAVCALLARDNGGPRLALQIPVSPVMDDPEAGRASYETYADGYFQTASSMRDFFKLYPRDAADLKNPYLLPLASDDLSGVAPALVMVGEYEVLRDEGEEYARRLTAAGVPCDLVRYDGQIHGFFGLLDDKMTVSAAVHRRAAAALIEAFHTAAC